MHIRVRCGAERKGGRAVAPQSSDTTDGPSRSPARFINLFGAERVGTKPDFFPVVRRSDSRIEQWSEILRRPSQTVSGKKGGKARSLARPWVWGR